MRVHGVGQAPLLPDLLEQPARHAAAEHLVGDRQGPAVVVVVGEAAPAEGEVGLLGVVVLDDHAAPAGAGGRRALGQLAAAPAPSKPCAHGVDHRVVVEAAGGGDHQRWPGRYQRSKNAAMSSRVMASTVGIVAEHLAAERVVGEQRLGQRACAPGPRASSRFMRISSRITCRSASTSCGPERRRGEHVGEDLERRAPIRSCGQPGVEGGVLPGGEGVHLAADRVDRLGDLAGRCASRCP